MRYRKKQIRLENSTLNSLSRTPPNSGIEVNSIHFDPCFRMKTHLQIKSISGREKEFMKKHLTQMMNEDVPLVPATYGLQPDDAFPLFENAEMF